MWAQEGPKKELLKGSKKQERDVLFQITVGLFKPFIIHGRNGIIEWH